MVDQTPPGSSSRPAGERGTALVVDDDPTSRRLLSLMLQHEGFATLEARSGEEALVCSRPRAPISSSWMS